MFRTNALLRLFVGCVFFSIALGFTNRQGPIGAQEAEPIAFEVLHPDRIKSLSEAFANKLPYIPGELLVRFKPGAEPRQQASALRVLRTDVRPENGRWIGDLLHLKGLSEIEPVHAAEMLRRQPEVLYAQPNFIRPFKAVPNDVNYTQQWHFDAINLPRAWDINAGGRAEVVVAVLDSGLTTTTHTFQFRIWNGRFFQFFPIPFARTVDFDHTRVRQGREFAFDWRWTTTGGEQILFDADGHGSHVAGTISQQTNNDVGFAGIAYSTTLLPLKVCWSYWDVQLFFSASGIAGFAPPNAAAVLTMPRWRRCATRPTTALMS
jgi:subtilase family protein/fervidolysin-like protein